jgi:hypothetical protein
MIQLQLQPEIEAQLAAEAQARGMDLDRYVAQLLSDQVAATAPATVAVTFPPYLLDEEQLERDLRQGLEDITAGRTRPAEEVFREFRERHRIPR